MNHRLGRVYERYPGFLFCIFLFFSLYSVLRRWSNQRDHCCLNCALFTVWRGKCVLSFINLNWVSEEFWVYLLDDDDFGVDRYEEGM